MNDLTVIQDPSPLSLFTRATDVAGVCGEIVKRTARNIQGRKYVQVEGWQSIAAAYGCIASATHVEKVEGGMRAIGEIRRASDGALLGTAEGFVGEDEPTWYGGESRGKTLPKRPEFAIRAMAQTRAISRVCRTAFAFVVVLIDNKLATTPAEEMDGVFQQETPQAQTFDEVARAAPEQVEAMKKALSDNGVEITSLLTKAQITDLSEMPSADVPNAIRWIQKQKKAA